MQDDAFRSLADCVHDHALLSFIFLLRRIINAMSRSRIFVRCVSIAGLLSLHSVRVAPGRHPVVSSIPDAVNDGSNIAIDK